MDDIVSGLIEEMRGMAVVDAHEHLPAEEELVAGRADVFTRLLCHYSMTNAVSAGMDPTLYAKLKDQKIGLDERWAMFRPYLDAIHETGYYLPARRAAQELCGADDITDDTYRPISEALQKENSAGIYDRLLARRCGIVCILNQSSLRTHPSIRVLAVRRDFTDLPTATAQMMNGMWKEANADAATDASTVSAFLDSRLARIRRDGAPGIKMTAALPQTRVDDGDAESLFRRLKEGRINDEESRQLGGWLALRAVARAPRHGLVVAVHCGLLWNGGRDFRAYAPTNLIPLIMECRETVFDLYHAGIPWVREIAVMANHYPNVNLNLAWCHQISPYMTEHVLNEWLDLVPVTKIIGFGGDNLTPEKTVGVLALAREVIARALAERVQRREMTTKRAVEICRLWLHDNPRRIYNLSQPL